MCILILCVYFISIRYVFALQIRRDLSDGQLVVNENTAALMAAYILQGLLLFYVFVFCIHMYVFVIYTILYTKWHVNFESSIPIIAECGDYCFDDYPDYTHLSGARFIPNQSNDFLNQVLENYKKLV